MLPFRSRPTALGQMQIDRSFMRLDVRASLLHRQLLQLLSPAGDGASA